MCYNQTQEHDSYDHKCIVSASSGHPEQRYNRVPRKNHNIIAPEDKSEKVADFQKHHVFCMVFHFS